MRRLSTIVFALACLALSAPACSPGGPVQERWRTERLTIGDTLVVRTVGATDEAARLSLEPELRIGEFEGADEYQFASVTDVVPAPDGGVYVWDNTLHSLRRYDGAGRFVRNVGRRGGGPGEYESSNGIAPLRGGRLALWDPRQARVSVYDSTGAPVSSWRAPGLIFQQRTLFADTAGNILMRTLLEEFDGANPTRERRTGLVRLSGTDGRVLDTIPAPPPTAPPQQLTAVRQDGPSLTTMSSTIPFAPQPAWTWSPHGYFVTAHGARYAIHLHRAGEPPMRIERELEALPVDPGERSASEESTTRMMRRNDPNWRWQGSPIPDRKPMLRGIRADADGRIWVTRSQPGEQLPAEETSPPQPGAPPPLPRWAEPLAYDVFAPDGRLLGFLRLPPRSSLLHMSGDRAWGVERDELDVPFVVRWRIVGLQ